MIGRYCFSFDRETFAGDFESRRAALETSFARARHMPDTPGTVYIGQRAPIDPGASGHAEPVIDRMRRLVFEAVGEPGSDYLARVGEHEQAELDDALAKAIRQWLTAHDLLPHSARVTAISEHSLPTSPSSSRGIQGREVNEIGSVDYAG